MVPAQFRVVVTRRPKYACRASEDGVLQTPKLQPPLDESSVDAKLDEPE